MSPGLVRSGFWVQAAVGVLSFSYSIGVSMSRLRATHPGEARPTHKRHGQSAGTGRDHVSQLDELTPARGGGCPWRTTRTLKNEQTLMRPSSNYATFALLAGFVLIWGTGYWPTEVASEHTSTVMLSALRVTGSALLLVAFCAP